MLNNAAVAETAATTTMGISNTALWGGLGAVALGAAAIGGGGSSSRESRRWLYHKHRCLQ